MQQYLKTIATYATKSWTLTEGTGRKLEAFRMIVEYYESPGCNGSQMQ